MIKTSLNIFCAQLIFPVLQGMLFHTRCDFLKGEYGKRMLDLGNRGKNFMYVRLALQSERLLNRTMNSCGMNTRMRV